MCYLFGRIINDRVQSIISKPGRTDLGSKTGWFQITEEYHGTDIQLEAIGGKALGTLDVVLS